MFLSKKYDRVYEYFMYVHDIHVQNISFFFFSLYIEKKFILLLVAMNTELQKIFESLNISEKDRHEYLQIFSFLPPHKRKNFLENAHRVMTDIEKMREKHFEEQQILFWNTLKKIEEKIFLAKKRTLYAESSQELKSLQSSIK